MLLTQQAIRTLIGSFNVSSFGDQYVFPIEFEIIKKTVVVRRRNLLGIIVTIIDFICSCFINSINFIVVYFVKSLRYVLFDESVNKLVTDVRLVDWDGNLIMGKKKYRNRKSLLVLKAEFQSGQIKNGVIKF